MGVSFFSGLEFVGTTDAERAANRVGFRYKSDTGNVFEVVGSDGEYVMVVQLSPGVFCGERMRWHVSSLNAMARVHNTY